MTSTEALKWLDILNTSRKPAMREMAYNRLRELITLLLPHE